MAILEKEVWVGIGSNHKYYEKLGYVIPRYKANNGILRVKHGTRIIVRINDLQNDCNVKVTKVCDKCGKIKTNQNYQSVIHNRKDGLDLCKPCSMKRARAIMKENIPYEKSLEHWATFNNKEYLLEEFSNKNLKTPSLASYGDNDIYFWNCSSCRSEFETRMGNRTISETNCPYCKGLKVNHTNCLWTTHPEIAKMLVDPQRGYKITAGSNKKEKFKCSDCGNVKSIFVYVAVRKFSCPKCSDGISYPEKFMMSVLNQLNISFETQKRFKWSDNRKYDFYVPKLHLIIETHGKQHYHDGFETVGGRSLEEEKENDKLKKQLAKENGIKNYIIINSSKSELQFIKKEVLESKLILLFNNLNIVNWIECHKFACNTTLVKAVCDLWNKSSKSTIAIGESLKLSKTTVRKYLNQGKILGWCDYDPKEVQKENGKLNGGYNKVKIIQLTKNMEYIKTWESITEAATSLSTYSKCIINVCKEKQSYKSAGGYKWMYKEDYDQYIEQTQISNNNLHILVD